MSRHCGFWTSKVDRKPGIGGDGVLNLEFHTKMNTMGAEVVEGINKSITIAEKNFKGIVIGNEGENFSAGANLGMLFMRSGHCNTLEQTTLKLKPP